MAAANRIAEAMSGNLRREMMELAAHAQDVGVEASARVAACWASLPSGMGAAPGLATVRGASVRMTLLASGVLAGVADALRDQPEAKKGELGHTMVSGVFSAARELPRLREISSVLIRHGLGDVVRRAGVVPLLERAGQVLHWGEAGEVAHLEPQQRVRLAFEELGPTFVKLGQMLSTREDLLPPAWTAELDKLHSQVAPVPFDELLPQVEQALGRSPFEVFGDLEREPYAAASIAQVHRAKLANGTPVILKIRRPGIEAKIDADLRILEHLAHLVEQEMPEARRYRPVQVVGQLRRSLERELDLAVEARNTERFARNFADDLDVLVPHVYWEWTSSVMNVQEHIEGIRGNDLAAIDKAGLDRKVLAARGADAVLKMILVDGFFQADPHPGNVMYLPGNRIALIDFGMVGRLSPVRRSQIVDLLAGFVRHDEETMLEVLLDWRGDDAVDEARLAADLGELAFDYADVPLKDLKIGMLLHRVSAILREHSIVLPADLTLLFKALITPRGARPAVRSGVPSGRAHQAVSRSRHARALSARGGVATRASDAQRLLRAGHLDAARSRPAGQRRAAWPHAGRPRSQAPRQLRRSPPQRDRSGDRRHHDRIAGDRLLDRDDGSGRADRVWHIAADLVWADRVPDCIREQPLDHPFDLALRPALKR